MTEESKTEAQTSPINGVVGVSFKDVMSVLPAVIAGLTVLVFTASAAREWAYYHVIGEDFISLASPADYTSAALRELSTSFAAATATAAPTWGGDCSEISTFALPYHYDLCVDDHGLVLGDLGPACEAWGRFLLALDNSRHAMLDVVLHVVQ